VTITRVNCFIDMKILDPGGSPFTVSMIPRFYPTGDLVFTIFNESTRTSEVVANSYVVENGYLKLTFTHTFTNKDRFQYKITEGAVIVYRGKIFVTDQETQDYKINDGLYSYG